MRAATAVPADPPSPSARLAALQGRWRVLRVVRHDGGARARFEGWAVWEGGRCVEEGVLAAGSARMPARRATLWSVEGRALHVAFEDGRPFHAVGCCAEHVCLPDRYALRYDFTAWPRWSCRWRVDGPWKAYAALTRYRRAGPSG